MSESQYKVIANNKKAFFNYFIDNKIEAGIVLKGSEVKSLRQGSCSIKESHAGEMHGRIYLFNCQIAEYKFSNNFNHEPRRPRALLLKKRESDRLIGDIKRKGVTIVPLLIYFNNKGMVKVELGIATGKKQYEKREVKKEQDWQRQRQRMLKH